MPRDDDSQDDDLTAAHLSPLPDGEAAWDRLLQDTRRHWPWPLSPAQLDEVRAILAGSKSAERTLDMTISGVRTFIWRTRFGKWGGHRSPQGEVDRVREAAHALYLALKQCGPEVRAAIDKAATPFADAEEPIRTGGFRALFDAAVQVDLAYGLRCRLPREADVRGPRTAEHEYEFALRLDDAFTASKLRHKRADFRLLISGIVNQFVRDRMPENTAAGTLPVTVDGWEKLVVRARKAAREKPGS